MNLNRYDPVYDPNAQKGRMVAKADGDWVHILTVRKLMRQLAACQRKMAELMKKEITDGNR